MNRRSFIKWVHALGALALINPSVLGHKLHAYEEAIEITFDDAFAEYLDGQKVEDGSKIMVLNIPDTPENGAVVPVEVTINHPMEAGNYIENITILTTKNKVNKAVSYDVSLASGMAYLMANVKMGQTQEVVILARTNSGKIYKASKSVQIALGGCG
ncbi:MAG: hypothetical protein KU37_07175 [Sulfuricurvum sp. PC08-66]|nr:MAG: hypothetical protein KU37_07175 [Sulfuricurvum sp. PC08-66]